MSNLRLPRLPVVSSLPLVLTRHFLVVHPCVQVILQGAAFTIVGLDVLVGVGSVRDLHIPPIEVEFPAGAEGDVALQTSTPKRTRMSRPMRKLNAATLRLTAAISRNRRLNGSLLATAM